MRKKQTWADRGRPLTDDERNELQWCLERSMRIRAIEAQRNALALQGPYYNHRTRKRETVPLS